PRDDRLLATTRQNNHNRSPRHAGEPPADDGAAGRYSDTAGQLRRLGSRRSCATLSPAVLLAVM
ncbi:MAG: hypothetical protein LC799_33635, partial [Actinobacteria bacterium]|nr:hypothetical protein [Actinomycetota bacterium]